MLSTRSQFVLSVTIAGLLLFSVGMSAQTSQSSRPTAATTAVAQQQTPLNPLDISFAEGQLTIKADNAPLIEVVRAVCKQVGADLDAQVQPMDPVTGTFGPGAPKSVLMSLLKDAHVNYVIGSTTEDPDALGRVAIYPRGESANTDSHVAQGQTGASEDGSDHLAGPSGILGLLETAKIEAANGVTLDPIDDGDGSRTPQQVDLTAVLEKVATQIEAAQTAQATSSSKTNAQQQGDPSATSDTAKSNPNTRPLTVPRHHRRHPH
jgi:hypothetical protein